MAKDKTYDFAVIGAGCFGAWSAYKLRQSGASVALLDSYGAASARASSGGESRIIRVGYGKDELYSRWASRALPVWKEFFERVRQPLFHQTGVLWPAREKDEYNGTNLAACQRLGVPHERMTRAEMEQRFPQFASGEEVTWALLETESGVLMARRAVQAIVEQAVKDGVDYRIGSVVTPRGGEKLPAITLSSGESISAGAFIFACGPWLPKLFPELLGQRIFPTRQEVYFLGPPQGDTRFRPPAMPTWINSGDEWYGMPDLENRGVKFAFDRHGPAFDPDTGKRVVAPEGMATFRDYVARRFPALKDAPIVETRVCQYENTSNGDFLIDKHPGFENVWLAGGGSGHGFKHGPMVGEYVASQVLGRAPVEPRFSLSSKGVVQQRTVH